jgi:predicted nuclease of restriction endonuclease-like (RecB) superfamily
MPRADLSKCVRPEEREFYIRLTHRDGWDKRRLEREIDAALFERYVLAPPILSPVVRELYPTAPDVFRDTYVLDFLNLPEPHSESDLQRGLVRDIRRFLQALGPDFCFIGEEYRIQVGGKDFFLDLLFYHRALLPCIGVLLWLRPPFDLRTIPAIWSQTAESLPATRGNGRMPATV